MKGGKEMVSQILEEFVTQQTIVSIVVETKGTLKTFGQSKIVAVDEVFFKLEHPHNNLTYTHPVKDIRQIREVTV